MNTYYFSLKRNDSTQQFDETLYKVMGKNINDAISFFAGNNLLRILDKEEPLNVEFESIKHGGIVVFKVQ